ncbi:LLM class flavin-dependent oxidoreductase [Rhodococcus jostii]|uniref:Flavin-dependent oxidoreductase, luciferase family (Includes alkanesulfonate monooxygenase SsuD and methylene tetrahydromethanopterin reductase) n=1 Tax=Rhodococcus jostii TaxID=132919 RepID=A0A1H4QWY9_RHOJO|nr:LLM class flavin-dependent oxidoreductase [Rhodococcus jostii]SEC23981.1 Flavin-dependent oxidoreductase, luciferase family (includes alkanesulfonate monooxygenase SsuD and methylene tetrahydromethanopterin reductase) [Rhodococcus jostii]
MKFGVVTQGYVRKDGDELTRIKQVVLEGQATERYGLDSFGVSEQHFKFPTNTTAAIDVVLAWVAATTERIRIKPGAVVPALRHPLAIAENWATLDTLSGGRVDFAVGRGNTPKTADAFEVPVTETNARTLEALEVIIKAWTNDEFDHHGTYWNFDQVRVTPHPVQSPHPPLSLAAVSVGACGLAGQHRLGLMGAANNLEWHQIEDRLRAYRESWETGTTIAGATPSADVSMFVPTHVASTMQAARDQAAYGIVEYTNRAMKQDLRNHELTYGTTKGMDTTGQFFDNFDGLMELTPLCVGTPDYTIEKILRLAEYDIDEVVFCIDYATHGELLECIRLLGEEVVPAIKQELAARDGRRSAANAIASTMP